MSPIHNPGLLLSLLFSCSVKTTIVLSIAWIAASLARRRSASFRHLLWAAAILTSLALPLFAILLPAWHSSVLKNVSGIFESAHASTSDPISQGFAAFVVTATTASPILGSLSRLALLLWFVGFLWFSARLLAGLAYLAWLSARCTPFPENDWTATLRTGSRRFAVSRLVRVLKSENPAAMPATWGLFRPVVLLPVVAAEWSDTSRRIVLFHELAHIARCDWPLQLCAEIGRAIYWFHPLAWLAASRLRQESEVACDDAVLSSGIDSSDYANQLLTLARTRCPSRRALFSPLAVAGPSNLERRFAAMLNPSVNRSRLSPRAKLLAVFSTLCLLLPLAALRLPAQGSAGELTGTVSDPSGASISNATVIVLNHNAAPVAMTTSDAKGNFLFSTLPAGDYELQALKNGFEPYDLTQLTLDPARTSSQNIRLSPTSATADSGSSVATKSGKQPQRISIKSEQLASLIVHKVPPAYPESSRSAGIQGIVTLQAVISKDGVPLSLRVMNPQIDPNLARSSVESVSQWRYRPVLLNGAPVEADTTIQVNFSLQP
ncbi:MAG TPA: M56 family metallopeptidase [Candidatus Acidoferrum sp.]